MQFETLMYYKPTNSFQVSHPSSNQSGNHKESAISSHVTRSIRRCTNEYDTLANLELMRSFFFSRGYSLGDINYVCMLTSLREKLRPIINKCSMPRSQQHFNIVPFGARKFLVRVVRRALEADEILVNTVQSKLHTLYSNNWSLSRKIVSTVTKSLVKGRKNRLNISSRYIGV